MASSTLMSQPQTLSGMYNALTKWWDGGFKFLLMHIYSGGNNSR